MNKKQLLYFSEAATIAKPPVPTREQVLGVNIHFMGGLIVDSPIYGRMPWYPPALSWCDYETRLRAYETMRAHEDTHAMIEIPNGFPLYDESNQFYSPDKFPALDWTAGETHIDSRLSDLVDEVIDNGFKYIINMDERFEHSTKIIQLVMKALSDEQLKYGFTMPGYDGVFYGWPASMITEWSKLAREIRPDCYLGIEFNPGHIPLGNGPKDYALGGGMDGFDVLLGEFESNIHKDSTWQVLGRCIKYIRPSDQPISDDPHPPFYLTDSPRGKREFCAFETYYPYNWVRVDMNNPTSIQAAINNINEERAYFRSCGCRFTG